MKRFAGFHVAPASQRGVGLIEVLVAVLILSIGFLGIAVLQSRSLSMNNSAMAHTVATMASYSIIDAMRADLAAAKAGNYNSNGSPIKANACPTATGTLADAQLTQWCLNQLAGLGVSASTTGSINCNIQGICTVTVTYDDSKSESSASDTSGMQAVTTQGTL